MSTRIRFRASLFCSVPRVAIRMENVGIAVADIEAAISFFTDLGLNLVGRTTVRGEWADIAVGLDGNHARVAMLETPDGGGRLELFEYLHPEAIDIQPTRPDEIASTAWRSRSTTSTRRSKSPHATAATRPRCRHLRGRLPAHVRAGPERHPRDARPGAPAELRCAGTASARVSSSARR